MPSILTSLARPMATAGRNRWVKLSLALGLGAAALSGCHYYDPYYDGPGYYGPPAYVAPSIYIGPGYRYRGSSRGRYRGNWRGRRGR